jgi:hypothetical protein
VPSFQVSIHVIVKVLPIRAWLVCGSTMASALNRRRGAIFHREQADYRAAAAM